MANPFVFSIRTAYVASILDGSKRWEYRTRRPSLAPGELFFIYETRPRCRVVAQAMAGVIVEDEPDVVWERTGAAGGITREEFDDYFEGRERAVAIQLAKVLPSVRAWPLPGGMAPPQSWARLAGPGVAHYSSIGRMKCSGCGFTSDSGLWPVKRCPRCGLMVWRGSDEAERLRAELERQHQRNTDLATKLAAAEAEREALEVEVEHLRGEVDRLDAVRGATEDQGAGVEALEEATLAYYERLRGAGIEIIATNEAEREAIGVEVHHLRICIACGARVPSGHISGCCHMAVRELVLDGQGVVRSARIAGEAS